MKRLLSVLPVCLLLSLSLFVFADEEPPASAETPAATPSPTDSPLCLAHWLLDDVDAAVGGLCLGQEAAAVNALFEQLPMRPAALPEIEPLKKIQFMVKRFGLRDDCGGTAWQCAGKQTIYCFTNPDRRISFLGEDWYLLLTLDQTDQTVASIRLIAQSRTGCESLLRNIDYLFGKMKKRHPSFMVKKKKLIGECKGPEWTIQDTFNIAGRMGMFAVKYKKGIEKKEKKEVVCAEAGACSVNIYLQ